MKQVRVRRFAKDGNVCWGRYLYCKPRRLWLRVGCESTELTCCAPESLPRGARPGNTSRLKPRDAVEFERLCPEARL